MFLGMFLLGVGRGGGRETFGRGVFWPVCGVWEGRFWAGVAVWKYVLIGV